MNDQQIQRFYSSAPFPDTTVHLALIETHISWVFLTDHYAFKIKKPVSFSFLDFSSLENRLHYCLQEVSLNKRLAPEMYLGVLPIYQSGEQILIGTLEEMIESKHPTHPKNGLKEATQKVIIDYAVVMKKMDPETRMDLLLNKQQVSQEDMTKLAHIIAPFHQQAPVISLDDWSIDQMREQFNGIDLIVKEVKEKLGSSYQKMINLAQATSDHFLKKFEKLLKRRVVNGFVRDIHGDFHAQNIFLLNPPVVFDCLEYSPEFRQIDVLNDIAFLCMDLERHGRQDLSDTFKNQYLAHFPAIKGNFEEKLFLYFKLYRANVRAKIAFNSAIHSEEEEKDTDQWKHALAYFHLMDTYLEEWHSEKKGSSCTCQSCACTQLRKLKAEYKIETAVSD